jgi:6-phosphofructokinase 1
MKKIGVLTSGGDAPGMNAVIRSVCRTALHNTVDCIGIMRGFQGLIENDMKLLPTTAVANILQRGGTMLKTARCQDFFEKEGRAIAAANLKKQGVEALVVIGGDGSFKGAQKLFEEHDIKVIGVPGTIDNDIVGTDYTIGFDTALNTAVSAIDKIKDTAEAHDRIFIVEVMGRDAGYLALSSGISCGAQHIFIPEMQEDFDRFVKEVTDDRKRNKQTNLIIVAEGDEFGGAQKINEYLLDKVPNLQSRVTILGHIQRGGSPSAFDRILASKMGYAAVNALLQNKSGKMIGIQGGKIIELGFGSMSSTQRLLEEDLTEMAAILSK